ALSVNERLTTSTPGNPLGARQLPESETRRTPVDVRSTNTFGLEAVSVTGFVHQRILPTARWSNPFHLKWSPRFGCVHGLAFRVAWLFGLSSSNHHDFVFTRELWNSVPITFPLKRH